MDAEPRKIIFQPESLHPWPNPYHIFTVSPNTGWICCMYESLWRILRIEGNKIWFGGMKFSVGNNDNSTICSPLHPQHPKPTQGRCSIWWKWYKERTIIHKTIKGVINAVRESKAPWELRRGRSLWFGMGRFSWNRELSGQGQVKEWPVEGVQGEGRSRTQSRETHDPSSPSSISCFERSELQNLQTNLQKGLLI